MLLFTLLVLSQAGSASEYPKVVRRDGKVCVQALNAKGAVEESCRAEGSEARTPLPSDSRVFDDRPLAPSSAPSLTPKGPPTAAALYWAEAKRNWALAFKVGTVGALSTTLVASIGALIAAGSGVPHAADAYLGTAGIAGAAALFFTVVAVLFDRWGYEELDPGAYAE